MTHADRDEGTTTREVALERLDPREVPLTQERLKELGLGLAVLR